jgi:phage-related protein
LDLREHLEKAVTYLRELEVVQSRVENQQLKTIEKRWQRDSWQLQQRIGLTVPESREFI